MFLMRLDDASEHMDFSKWLRMQEILDEYRIKPIFAIIPHNEDKQLLQYDIAEQFWDWVRERIVVGWQPALHGYNHVCESEEGGINPVNDFSEFAGLPYKKQCEKIRNGYKILKEQNVDPEIFVAPSHTFDSNTLQALEDETPIRVISDTIANDVYFIPPFYFIPQQSGKVRRLPFSLTTFCYHPNTMNANDFVVLKSFLEKHNQQFTSYSKCLLKRRKKKAMDKFLSYCYFVRR